MNASPMNKMVNAGNQTVNSSNEMMNKEPTGEGKPGSECKPNGEYTSKNGWR